MISDAIEKYDSKQEVRHRENSQKLDRNEEAVNQLQGTMQTEFKSIRQSFSDAKNIFAQSQGAEKYKQYIFPTLLSVGLVIIGILDLIKR